MVSVLSVEPAVVRLGDFKSFILIQSSSNIDIDSLVYHITESLYFISHSVIVSKAVK